MEAKQIPKLWNLIFENTISKQKYGQQFILAFCNRELWFYCRMEKCEENSGTPFESMHVKLRNTKFLKLLLNCF